MANLKTISINLGAVIMSDADIAVSRYFGYQTNIPDLANPGNTIPNPETKGQFIRRMKLMEYQDQYTKGVALGIQQAAQVEANNNIVPFT